MRYSLLATVFVAGMTMGGMAARSATISADELNRLCEQKNGGCGVYLQGIYDGIIEASKTDRTRLVCAPKEPSAAQLSEYYRTAYVMAGEQHSSDPAVYVAYAAFTLAMPCK